jgi:hypothetical protein
MSGNSGNMASRMMMIGEGIVSIPLCLLPLKSIIIGGGWTRADSEGKRKILNFKRN